MSIGERVECGDISIDMDMDIDMGEIFMSIRDGGVVGKLGFSRRGRGDLGGGLRLSGLSFGFSFSFLPCFSSS